MSKFVLVIGLGISGNSVIEYLKSINEKIIALDKIDDVHFDFNKIKYVVKSPGICEDILLIKKFKKKNINILTEIELAYLNFDVDFIGITGTNGKSTVTSLVHHIMEEESIICGNIGLGICSEILKSKNKIVICELSSFQLKNIRNFKPKIACILNLSIDHQDFHKTISDYYNSKINITKNFTKNDVLICSKDVSDYIGEVKYKKIIFSEKNIKDNSLYYNGKKIINLNDVSLIGQHNYLNILAAIMIVKELNISEEVIKKKIKSFIGLEHRLEYICELDNKFIYNDSKSTNMASVQVSLNSFENKSISLLMGGFDKNEKIHLSNLNNTNIISFGDVKDKIFLEFNDVIKADSICDAVKIALNLDNEIILFSPGFSSFDMFNSYEERGDYFKKIILNLK